MPNLNNILNNYPLQVPAGSLSLNSASGAGQLVLSEGAAAQLAAADVLQLVGGGTSQGVINVNGIVTGSEIPLGATEAQGSLALGQGVLIQPGEIIVQPNAETSGVFSLTGGSVDVGVIPVAAGSTTNADFKMNSGALINPGKWLVKEGSAFGGTLDVNGAAFLAQDFGIKGDLTNYYVCGTFREY